jgi:hypothetical protein
MSVGSRINALQVGACKKIAETPLYTNPQVFNYGLVAEVGPSARAE